MFGGGRRGGWRLATLCACALMLALGAAQTASAAFGDARILAPFPSDPGFPEGVAVDGDRVYAAGAATFGTTGTGPTG